MNVILYWYSPLNSVQNKRNNNNNKLYSVLYTILDKLKQFCCCSLSDIPMERSAVNALIYIHLLLWFCTVLQQIIMIKSQMYIIFQSRAYQKHTHILRIAGQNRFTNTQKCLQPYLH